MIKTLFRDKMLSSYFEEKTKLCGDYINKFNEKYFLDNSRDSLICNIYNIYIINKLKIVINDKSVEVLPKKVMYRDPFDGRNFLRDGVQFVVSYPFEGDHKLFDCKPSSFGDYPKGRIVSKELYFEIDLPLEEKERFREILSRQENLLEDCVRNQSNDIDRYNRELNDFICINVDKKRAYFEEVRRIREENAT